MPPIKIAFKALFFATLAVINIHIFLLNAVKIAFLFGFYILRTYKRVSVLGKDVFM